MRAIYLREVGGYFSSMIAYLTVGLLWIILGLMMWVFPDFSVMDAPFVSLEGLFGIAPIIFVFLIPAFTMRSIAEERQNATIELLLTRPVSAWQVVFGKYFAILTWLFIALLPTTLYVYSLYQLGLPKGNLDLGEIAASAIGLFLLGAVFCAIGLWASSLTRNQIIAFVLSVFFCFILYYGFYFLSRIPVFRGNWDAVIESLGIDYHYHSISRGVLDTRDLIYFICVIGICLTWTWSSLAKRK